MRPTGRLHLGHYHGALKNWVRLQSEMECFYFVADWHALTTHYESSELIEQNVYEGVRNPWEIYITDPTNAVGQIFATNNLELNTTWGNSTTNTKNGLSIVQIVPGTNEVFVPAYSYSPEPAANVAARVKAEAGAGHGPFAP